MLQVPSALLWAAAFHAAAAAAAGAEANPPEWPSTVQVFGPETASGDIEAAVNAAFQQNGGSNPEDNGQFSEARFAFLFKPGQYNVEVPVGFYTQVLGLGEQPGDVVFTSSKGVYCEEGSTDFTTGALQTFWRGAENFQTNATADWNNGMKGMIWATSQGAPLRNVVVTGDLTLFEHIGNDPLSGYASGGYLGNSQILGTVRSGSQQQFLSRNVAIGTGGKSFRHTWPDGVWNMNFVGTVGAPPNHCGKQDDKCNIPVTNVDAAPVIAEKPFITIDAAGKYSLNIPQPQSERRGFDFSPPTTRVGFEDVYVARADVDSADSINAKLKAGLHVVLSPGLYELQAPLELMQDNQVLLGLGFPTLIAAGGKPVVKVGNVDGVRISAILMEAGNQPTETLLQWGDGAYSGNAENPGVMHDIFARVGGPATPATPQAKVMLTLNNGHIVADNLWLWRADHTVNGLVKDGACPCDVGAIVNGDDVHMYGFKVEHALTDLVQWNGERGRTYFFQSEFPYDVTQDYADSGFVAYRVSSKVQEHNAFGMGAYHYFRDNAVVLQTCFSAPPHLEANFQHPVAVYLDGQGTALHILNDKGGKTTKSGLPGAQPVWLCSSDEADLRLASGPWRNSSYRTSLPPCDVGGQTTCPGTSQGCAGNSCCPDGSVCPSADKDWMCCPSPKEEDCTGGITPPSPPTPAPPGPAPSPGASCKVGDVVKCPDAGTNCQGNQCCLDGTTCPSAEESFNGCPSGKVYDCLKPPVVIETEIVV